MLSSQTKDEITYNAMLRLRENNLTPEAICGMKASVLENILHPVSFYKVRFIIIISMRHMNACGLSLSAKGFPDIKRKI